MAVRDQERAKFALARINEGGGDREKLRTQVVKLPARLHTSGLGQTVAFYLASTQRSPEARMICQWLQEWLGPDHAGVFAYAPASAPAVALIEAITGGTPHQYRRAAGEARALAVWLKRFAEAFIEDKNGAGR